MNRRPDSNAFLAPEARPAFEALGPERAAPFRATAAAQVKTAKAVQRLRDGAGHGGAWADPQPNRR